MPPLTYQEKQELRSVAVSAQKGSIFDVAYYAAVISPSTLLALLDEIDELRALLPQKFKRSDGLVYNPAPIVCEKENCTEPCTYMHIDAMGFRWHVCQAHFFELQLP